MNTFCTIINRNYIPFASALYQSLAGTDPAIRLQVLVTDAEKIQDLPAATSHLVFHPITHVLDSTIARRIYDKYAATNDQLRWALKPVFLIYLLGSFEKVIYSDPDTWFPGSHGFLFAELDKYDILLSPHWSNLDPLKDEDGLYSVMRNGLYSGCFVGAAQGGVSALEWWAGACHYKMEKVKELGLYDDQKYLDVLPLLNEKTGIIRHPGCNITSINIETCKRSMVNGAVMINEAYPLVFIHFTKDTIINIRNGNDPLLKPCLEKYTAAIKNAGGVLPDGIDVPATVFHAVKRKLLLRTRWKRFLLKLAGK